MTKKLPKTIFVVWDAQPNDENQYLLAAEKWQDHASMGEVKYVGTYQLVEQQEVFAPPQKSKPRPKRS